MRWGVLLIIWLKPTRCFFGRPWWPWWLMAGDFSWNGRYLLKWHRSTTVNFLLNKRLFPNPTHPWWVDCLSLVTLFVYPKFHPMISGVFLPRQDERLAFRGGFRLSGDVGCGCGGSFCGSFKCWKSFCVCADIRVFGGSPVFQTLLWYSQLASVFFSYSV